MKTGVVKGSFHDLDTRNATGHLNAMVRKLRIEYPGAIYQVLNRGDLPETNFKVDRPAAPIDASADSSRRKQTRTMLWFGRQSTTMQEPKPQRIITIFLHE